MNQNIFNKKVAKIRVSHFLMLGVIFVASFSLIISLFWTTKLNTSTVSSPANNIEKIPNKIAAESISLENYCKNDSGKYDGYYHVGSEPLCSRAPWCGPIYSKLLAGESPGSPSDTNGYDYDSINTTDKMPNSGACADVGGPQATYVEKGLYPLCCYEIERTGDAQKCIAFFERKYCHPSQCSKIYKSESDCDPTISSAACKIIVDHNKEIGQSTYSCGVNLEAWGHDLSRIASPVPLSVRLGVTGVATNTPIPTGGDDLTPTPSQQASPTPTSELSLTNSPTPTSTLTATPSNTPTNTPTSTPTKTPTLTPTITHTPTPTITQTPTSTPTITPTRTPTPPSTAICDKTCGVCGWRDTTGVCHTAGIVPSLGTACCYSTCIGNVCKQVTGFGTDSCIASQACVSGKVINIATTTSPATGSASLVSTKTPVVTIIYITATPKPGSQNNIVVQNQQPTTITQQNITQQPIATQRAVQQNQPPISGNTSWMLLVVVPIIIIGAALIF